MASRLLFGWLETDMIAGTPPFASLLVGLVIRALGVALLGPALLLVANLFIR